MPLNRACSVCCRNCCFAGSAWASVRSLLAARPSSFKIEAKRSAWLMSWSRTKLSSITRRQKAPIQGSPAPMNATRKGRTLARGNVLSALALHVPPHIGALLLLQHERRGLHAQGTEYWTEKGFQTMRTASCCAASPIRMTPQNSTSQGWEPRMADHTEVQSLVWKQRSIHQRGRLHSPKEIIGATPPSRLLSRRRANQELLRFAATAYMAVRQDAQTKCGCACRPVRHGLTDAPVVVHACGRRWCRGLPALRRLAVELVVLASVFRTREDGMACDLLCARPGIWD